MWFGFVWFIYLTAYLCVMEYLLPNIHFHLFVNLFIKVCKCKYSFIVLFGLFYLSKGISTFNGLFMAKI